jgi:phage recombination protein Bet
MKEVTIEYKVPQGDTIKLTPATVRNYLVNGDGNLTDQEVVAFLQLCRYRRLNPFLKEAHLIKYGNAPATMVVGRDVFTKRAAAHAAYDGIDSGFACAVRERGSCPADGIVPAAGRGDRRCLGASVSEGLEPSHRSARSLLRVRRKEKER